MLKFKTDVSEQSNITDTLLLCLAGLIGVGMCFTIIGLLPVSTLIIGLILSIRSGEMTGVRATTRLIQSLGLAGALVCAVAAGYAVVQANELTSQAPADPERDAKYNDAASLTPSELSEKFGYEAAGDMQSEYLNTLRGYEQFEYELGEINDRRDDLVFATLALLFITILLSFIWLRPLSRQLSEIRNFRLPEKVALPKPSVLMARKPLSSFSVADELRKWSELLEEGLITEQEFTHAREQLLRQR